MIDSRAAEVALILNLHAEGELALATLGSLGRALAHAAERGIGTEVVIVLDRADEATRTVAQQARAAGGPLAAAARIEIVETDHGDLGLARNSGLEHTTAEFVGTLDGDNLISANWIAEASALLREEPGAVAHPELQLFFEGIFAIDRNPDVDDASYRAWALAENNLWDAFAMAHRELRQRFPYQPTPAGFGSEDWQWNSTTLHAGVRHRTVPGTMLYYRFNRSGSLLSSQRSRSALVGATPLLRSRELARASLAEGGQPPPRPAAEPAKALALRDDWAANAALEPKLPAPANGVIEQVPWLRENPSAAGPAHWWLVDRLPDEIDTLVIGDDLLIADGVEVGLEPIFRQLAERGVPVQQGVRERVVATIAVQYRPRTVHIRRSALARSTLALHGDALRAHSEVVEEGGPLAASVPRPEGIGEGSLITIIVPTYQGADRITTCLDDLAAQTLPPDMFDVVVVQNGPPTDTPRIVAEWQAAHPAYQVRLIETEVASAQNARNIVLDGAAGPIADWVGFVDDDDRLQPRYLEALWDAAAPGQVPYGRVGIVVEGALDRIDEDSWLTTIPRQYAGKPRGAASNADLWPAINPAWAKIAERSVIGEVRFDPSIKYADDTLFWMEVLARSGASLTVTDFREDSAYLWVQRAGTITRSGGDPWDTLVINKLEAIEQMRHASSHTSEPATLKACDRVCEFFWSSVVSTARQDAETRQRVIAEVRRRELGAVPWAALQEGMGGQLAFLDASDPATARRLVGAGVPAAVVARSQGPRKDADLRATLDEVLTGVITLPADPTSWQMVGRVSSEIRDYLAAHPAYVERLGSLRSDADGPLEHLLAATLKIARPDWPWTAHLGSVRVARRGLAGGDGGKAAVVPDEIFTVLTGALAAAVPELTEVPETLGAFAEVAIAVLADHIEFADELQQEAYLRRLSAAGTPETVRDRVATGAGTDEQPAPAPKADVGAAPQRAATRTSQQKGSTVGHVRSPLQVLNLAEYCAATGVTPDLVIVDHCLNEQNIEQMYRVLELVLPGVPTFAQRLTGGWKTPDWSTTVMFPELTQALLPYLPMRRFVFGEYNAVVLWQLVNELGLQGPDVVLVDDGTATMGIDRPRELAARAGEPATDGLDHRPVPQMTFFTTFADQVRAAAGDIVIPNKRALLRERFREVALDDSMVFVVGSPLLEAGVVTSGDLELAVELVEEARRWCPEATVGYVAHRWERPEKLEVVRSMCEVLIFDLPFELVAAQIGTCPSRFVGNVSTLLGNLADLTEERVAIRSFRLPTPLVAEDRRVGVDIVTETAARQYSRSISVLDYSALADPV